MHVHLKGAMISLLLLMASTDGCGLLEFIYVPYFVPADGCGLLEFIYVPYFVPADGCGLLEFIYVPYFVPVMFSFLHIVVPNFKM